MFARILKHTCMNSTTARVFGLKKGGGTRRQANRAKSGQTSAGCRAGDLKYILFACAARPEVRVESKNVQTHFGTVYVV